MNMISHRRATGYTQLESNLHRLSETLLVYGKLDGDVWQVSINFLVRSGFDCRVVLRILVILSDGTEAIIEGERSDRRPHILRT